MTAPHVAVVLVNWNTPGETVECIRSLGESEMPVWRVYVVDNASEDGSISRIERDAPEAHLIRSGKNLGYAGGFNRAWPAALDDGADYIWLLNNDTRIAPDTLEQLLEASDRAGAALISPQVRYMDDPEQIWYLGGKLDWRMRASHIEDFADLPRSDTEALVPIEWASGCSMFLPADVLKRAGAMDERYFLYLEDVDWSLSLRERGIGVYIAPKAIVYHGLAASMEIQEPWHVEYYGWRNHYLIVKRHGSWWQKLYAYSDLAFRHAKTIARLTLFPSYRTDKKYLARSTGLIDFTRRRFGPFVSSDVYRRLPRQSREALA